MSDNEINIIERLQEENNLLKEENEILKIRIEELEKLIAIYENPHTPPSLKRGGSGKNHKKNGGKKPGQKKGHKGVTRPRAEPDKQVDVTMGRCPYCDAELSNPVSVESRIIEEIPEPQPVIVTEYKIAHYTCPGCQLNFVGIIDEICCGEQRIEGPSPGKFFTAWAINRVLDPLSVTTLEKWIPTTDLPRLMGLSPAKFTKKSFLTALDFVCYDDNTTGQIRDFTPQIDDALYRHWRESHPLTQGETETVAYDLTSLLFFGVGCSLAELGYNAKRVKRRQVNLALLVSKQDKYGSL